MQVAYADVDDFCKALHPIAKEHKMLGKVSFTNGNVYFGMEFVARYHKQDGKCVVNYTPKYAPKSEELQPAM